MEMRRVEVPKLGLPKGKVLQKLFSSRRNPFNFVPKKRLIRFPRAGQ